MPWLVAALAALLLATHVALTWALRDGSLPPTEDSAIYVLLARSLRSLEYSNLFFVDSAPHRMYPPGYPAMLAAASLVTGENVGAYIALGIAIQTASLLLVFLAIRRWSAALALGSLALLALNPSLVIHGGRPYSESLFAFLTIACLLLLANRTQDATQPAGSAAGSRPHESRAWIAGAIALAAFAALTRLIGVVLLIAVVMHFALHRRWAAAAAMAVVGALTAGAWIVWSVYMAEPTQIRSYAFDAVVALEQSGSSPLGPIRTILNSARLYISSIVPSTLGIPLLRGTSLDNLAAGGVVGAGLFAGMILLLRRHRGAALYLAGTAALLSIWAWRTDRFLFPVLPMLVPVVLAGLAWFGGRISRTGQWALPAVVSLFMLAGALPQIRTAFEQRDLCQTAGPHLADRNICPWFAAPTRAYMDAIAYMRTELPAETRLFNTFPASVYYHTGLRSIPYDEALVQPPGTIAQYLEERWQTRYALVNPVHSLSRRVSRHLAQNCDAFIVERYFGANTYLVRLRQPGESPGPGDAGDGCTVLPPVERTGEDGITADEAKRSGGYLSASSPGRAMPPPPARPY